MPPLAAPNTARHARLFELLRQTNQAELTSERLSAAKLEWPEQSKFEDWCKTALSSFGIGNALSNA